jgi:hypothetical protein
LRIGSRLANQLSYQWHEARILELANTYIHSNVEPFRLWPMRPKRKLSTCSFQNPIAETVDEASRFGQRDKFTGRDHPPRGMPPAQKRFGAGYLSSAVQLLTPLQAGDASGTRFLMAVVQVGRVLKPVWQVRRPKHSRLGYWGFDAARAGPI